ncbi:protein YhfH [Anaerobacillus sp. MEB173]
MTPNNLITPSTEFFRNLPPKKCAECGNNIDEQHDCYSHQCENCLQKG